MKSQEQNNLAEDFKIANKWFETLSNKEQDKYFNKFKPYFTSYKQIIIAAYYRMADSCTEIYLPKEIAVYPNKTEIALFDFHSGINYLKEKNLIITDNFSEVLKGTHYMMRLGGEIMFRVSSKDFSGLPRIIKK